MSRPRLARPMAETCPRCLMAFPQHIVVRARCTKRWRGHNFDQAAAEGNVGAAVAEVLGLPVRTSRDLEAFLRRAFVRGYGQGLDPNPSGTFDAAEGEAFEFHVGLREAVPPEAFARLEAAVLQAVGSSRHFVVANSVQGRNP